MALKVASRTTQFASDLINFSRIRLYSSSYAVPFYLKGSYTQKRSYIDPANTATYGGRHAVTLIPADGIGPSLIAGIQDVFRSAGVPIDFEDVQLSGDDPEASPDSIDDVITSVQRNGTALKGNWVSSENRPPGTVSLNVQLRHKLNLFANVVHCKSFPTVETRHKDVDLIIVRENTEGEYSNLEHENVDGVIEMLKIVTRKCSERIARFAFEYAIRHGRKKVTAIHKANIMKMSDGLFLNTCRQISKDYPTILFNDLIVDNCSMQLVSKPQQFDVMVMPNLYGNVITNIAAALIGGPGLPPGANYGHGCAIFESGNRNSGKGMANQDVANPMGMLFASTQMLTYLGLPKYATLIDSAIHNIVTSHRARPSDIGGTTKTTEFFEILVDEIEATRARRSGVSRN